MTSDVFATVTKIICSQLKNDQLTITESTTAGDTPGWDSLTHVGIILEIETTFNIRFRAAEIARLDDVGALVALIETRVE